MRNILHLICICIGVAIYSQSDVNKIDTLSLSKVNPIIVKNDTLIYHVESFTDKHDETLESVLSKMRGVKILANGEIEINGKLIKKILIDNKEVSDFGAALITKSLSPNNIENIEIRLNEKNKKIKESIIDKEKVAVLDINLKKEVNKRFFGKQQLSLGHQNKVKIGGLSNIMSINSKTNIHFFAENNNFGKNTIELRHIKNIGEESMAKIFTLPINIDDIKSRTTYHEDIYGFDNFVSNDKSIMGVSINVPLNEKTDFYFGSFNNYNFMSKEFLQETYLYQDLLYRFKNNNNLTEYNSKNKIQLKHVSNRFKIKSDINYAYLNQNTYDDINDGDIIFAKKHINKGIYINGELEYAFHKNLGVYYNTSFALENFNINTQLKSVNYFPYNASHHDNFYQNNENKQFIKNNELGMIYKTSSLGTHTLGYKHHANILHNKKISNHSEFDSEKEKLMSEQHTVFYKNKFNKNNLYVDLGIEYSMIKFPNVLPINKTYTREKYFQYNGKITYTFDNFSNIILSSQSTIDQYPLYKILKGNVLKDFQTIFTTRNKEIKPFYNRIHSITYSKDWKNKKGIVIAYVHGISNNLNNQHYANNFIYTDAEQLGSKYHLFSSTFKGRFKKLRISYEIAPEFIINSSEQIVNHLTDISTAYRLLMGAKLYYTSSSKKISVSYFPKYSYFIFENSIKGNKISNVFDFLSNKINLDLLFIDKKLKVNLGYKQVNFMKTKNSFINVDLNLVYKAKKYRFELDVNNILNQKGFLMQDLNNSIRNISNNVVFGRFVNLGVEMNFK